MAIKDKVVVITGASSGIGQATAEVLASAGANVVIGARRIDRLKQIAGEFSDGQVLYQQTDVTQRDQVKSLVDLAVSKFGKLDVLYNNAGLMPLSQLAELKVNEWDRMIDVNLKGVLYGIAAALPIMIKQKHGHVITTDSVAGHVVHPGTAVYAGTKYAIQAVMDGLRQEQVGNHIKTTMISPGAVETELYRNHFRTRQSENKLKSRSKKMVLKPIDIAHALLNAN